MNSTSSGSSGNQSGICVRAFRSEFILYGQQKPGMVKGIPLGALEPKTEVIIPMVDLSRPTAMDYHAKEKHLYIADSQKLKIERQNIDNGTKEDFLSKGLEFIYKLIRYLILL